MTEDVETAEAGPTDERSPGEVLAIAGNETRLAILRALFEAEGNRLGYAELMDAIGIRDSGQFNYHLSKLVGPFVRKVDDGYELRHAGGQVIGAVLAGTYAGEREIGPVDVDGECPTCGGSLLARYEGDFAEIACTDCGTPVTRDSVPPGIFDGHDESDLPDVLGRWVRLGFARTIGGFCPVCAGPAEATLGAPEQSAVGGVGIAIHCRRCGVRFTAGVGAAVLDHPAVVRFYDDHGIDLREVPLWELDWLLGEDAAFVGEDPPIVELPIDLGEERLVLTIDADCSVRSVERTTR